MKINYIIILIVRIKCLYLFKLKIMSILKFSDGEEFDLSGPLKIELRDDGWYVSGENRLIPVDSYHEAEKTIKRIMGDQN